MTGLALIFIGFSLLIAISLGLTQFRPGKFESALARGMGLAVLAALFTLQVAHFAWLYYDRPWVAGGFYQLALFAVAPAFYLFSQPEQYTQVEKNKSIFFCFHSPHLSLTSLQTPFECLTGVGVRYSLEPNNTK